MAGKISKTKSDVDFKKIWSFIIDAALAVVAISLINLLVVTVFNLSPRGLLEGGIETNLYERKMEIYDYVSLGYLILIIAYLSYFRKYFSPGNELLKIKK